MTFGLRFVSQMAISSYRRKKNEDSSPLSLHVVTKIPYFTQSFPRLGSVKTLYDGFNVSLPGP